MDRKISREQFEKAVKQVGHIQCNWAENFSSPAMAKRIAKDVAEIFEVEVEDPPILPGVDQREWMAERANDGLWHIYAGGYGIATIDSYKPPGGFAVSKDETDEAHAKVIAASKELAEKLYALLKWLGFCNWHQEDTDLIRESIDALEKAGVDVDRFRR